MDFRGTYKDFLIKKGIKVKEIVHKNGTKGFRFVISTCSSVARLDCFTNYNESADRAIGTFLYLLGDKTVFIDSFGREHRLNW